MAFALMLDFVRAIPTRLAKETLRYHYGGSLNQKDRAALALRLPTPQGSFLENHRQSQ